MTKAVIYTHFGALARGISAESAASDFKKYTEICERYLEYNKTGDATIGLVYCYVDRAVRAAVPAYNTADRRFQLAGDDLREENKMKGLLLKAESEARRKLGLGPDAPPAFEFVGLSELVTLLTELVDANPKSLEFLRGSNEFFGYDSPKFVDAILRLARSDVSHLAPHPVVRVDEDVIPKEGSLSPLLRRYDQVARTTPFFLFSGRYSQDGPGNGLIDGYAVRVTSLLKRSKGIRTRSGRELRPPLDKGEQAAIKRFLQGIGNYGGEQTGGPGRRPPQPISGAGLIMSPRAVSFLPPFMCFDSSVVWVDDHSKRLLHEAIGDIDSFQESSVSESEFLQDRHPDGIQEKDLAFARRDYPDRLLRGCVLDGLLMHDHVKPTSYSRLIGDMVRYAADVDLDNGGAITGDRWREVAKEIDDLALVRYDKVISEWRSFDDADTPLREWMRETDEDRSMHRSKICGEVTRDATRYVVLVKRWQAFVRAVQRLDFVENRWLYREPSGASSGRG